MSTDKGSSLTPEKRAFFVRALKRPLTPEEEAVYATRGTVAEAYRKMADDLGLGPELSLQEQEEMIARSRSANTTPATDAMEYQLPEVRGQGRLSSEAMNALVQEELRIATRGASHAAQEPERLERSDEVFSIAGLVADTLIDSVAVLTPIPGTLPGPDPGRLRQPIPVAVIVNNPIVDVVTGMSRPLVQGRRLTDEERIRLETALVQMGNEHRVMIIEGPEEIRVQLPNVHRVYVDENNNLNIKWENPKWGNPVVVGIVIHAGDGRVEFTSPSWGHADIAQGIFSTFASKQYMPMVDRNKELEHRLKRIHDLVQKGERTAAILDAVSRLSDTSQAES